MKMTHISLKKKINTLENKIKTLEANFLPNSRNKRSITIAIVIGALIGLGITSLGLYADLKSTVNTLQE